LLTEPYDDLRELLLTVEIVFRRVGPAIRDQHVLACVVPALRLKLSLDSA